MQSSVQLSLSSGPSGWPLHRNESPYSAGKPEHRHKLERNSAFTNLKNDSSRFDPDAIEVSGCICFIIWNKCYSFQHYWK